MRHRRVGVPIAVAGLMVLSGCWPQIGHGAEHQNWNPFEDRLTAANVATLDEAWTAEFDDLVGEPIVQGGRVFVTHTDAGAFVTALRTATGATDWERRIDPSSNATAHPSTAVVLGDELMATWSAGDGCTFGEVRIDPASGAVTEAATTTPAFRSTPVPFGDRFAQREVIITQDACDSPFPPPPPPDHIVVRDTDTGEVLWLADDIHDERLPAVGGGHLFAGRNQLVGYDVDGCGAAVCTPLWHALDGNSGSWPVVVGDHVFASRGRRLVAIDAATGATAWEGTTGTGSGYLVHADGVVYNTAGGTLFAFDADGCGTPTCAPLWSAPLPTWTPTSGWSVRAAAGGLLYLVGADRVLDLDGGVGRVVALDPTACAAQSCAPLWDSGELTGAPQALVVAEGRVFLELFRRQPARPDVVVAFAPAA